MKYGLKDTVGTVRLFLRLNEGEGTKLRAYDSNIDLSYMDFADMKWMADTQPVFLCPADFIPHANPKDNSMCCEEQYALRYGFDKYGKALEFPSLQGVFQGDGTISLGKGSICMYIMATDSTDIFENNAKKLFTYQNLTVKAYYLAGKLYIKTVNATDATNFVHLSANFSLPVGVWDSFCYTFKVDPVPSALPNLTVSVYEMVENAIFTGDPHPVSELYINTKTSYLTIFDDDPGISFIIKNIVIYNDAVEPSDFSKYYWMPNMYFS